MKFKRIILKFLYRSKKTIDIDEELLRRFEQRVQPLSWDYLNKRDKTLVADVYAGSIDSPHDCLANTDVVVCIEIIEHLFPETEQNCVHNIFGSIQPKIAIFTTPNGEFNVLFGPPRYENGFRHEDHKFEWTRAQFVDWALNICQRYPMYRVAFGGIGSPPDGMDWPAIGDCTQYACFVQKRLVDLLHQPEHPDDQPKNEAENTESETSATDTTVVYPIEKFPYKFLFSYEFPAYVETRSHVEVVMDSVKYFITRNSIDESRFLDEDRNALVIPVSDLFVCVHEAASEAELRNIIEKEYVLENDCIVHSMENEESDTSTDYDEDEDARENVDAVDGKDEDSW